MGQWGLNSYDNDEVMDLIDGVRDGGFKKKLTTQRILDTFDNAAISENWGGDERFNLVGIILYGLKEGLEIPPEYLRVSRNMMRDLIQDPGSLDRWAKPLERGGMMVKELLILEAALKKAMKHQSC